MINDLFKGSLVRLATEEPQAIAEAFCKWARDTEYARLLGSDIAVLQSVKKAREWVEKGLEREDGSNCFFNIRTLAEDRMIGFVGLDGVSWSHGDAFVGIGLGEREYWGKGYGTDAMRILLRYAFTELNLRRVSLDVFEYNPRAVKSYEKAGFTYEGRARKYLNRDGKRWDLIFMGILKEEWETCIQRNPTP